MTRNGYLVKLLEFSAIKIENGDWKNICSQAINREEWMADEIQDLGMFIKRFSVGK